MNVVTGMNRVGKKRRREMASEAEREERGRGGVGSCWGVGIRIERSCRLRSMGGNVGWSYYSPSIATAIELAISAISSACKWSLGLEKSISDSF